MVDNNIYIRHYQRYTINIFFEHVTFRFWEAFRKMFTQKDWPNTRGAERTNKCSSTFFMEIKAVYKRSHNLYKYL